MSNVFCVLLSIIYDRNEMETPFLTHLSLQCLCTPKSLSELIMRCSGMHEVCMAFDDLHSGSEKLLPAISGLVMTEYISTKTEGIHAKAEIRRNRINEHIAS